MCFLCPNCCSHVNTVEQYSVLFKECKNCILLPVFSSFTVGHINESSAKWCVIPGLLGMSDKKWRPIAIGSAVISDLIPDGAQILCAVFSP